MEISDIHLKRPDRRQEHASLIPGETTIQRMGLECWGTYRSYCAFFTPDGKVTYIGHGEGLEGNATGNFEQWKFKNLCLYIDELNIESFADEFQDYSCTVSWSSDALFHTWFLFETTDFIKTVASYDGSMPPLFRIVAIVLNNLLDFAEWDEKDFFIQRDLSVKLPTKRKWG